MDDDESVQAIRYALDRGVNWVDTAAVYGLGHSEEVVGRALQGLEARPYVFTKCGRSWYGRPDGEIENDLRPESIRHECEQSLRRLGLECIDLYQIHWPDWSTGTPLEESWATMAALVDEGKARWIGVSNFDVEQLERCEAIRHVDSVQPPLSLLARGARTTVVEWARANGTGVIVYSPMASGLLTGAYDRDRVAGSPGRLAAALAQLPGAGADAQPRPRRPAAAACRAARDDHAGAGGRLGAGAAGRDRGDRRRPPATSGRRLAPGRGASSSSADALAEIDAAIVATGAGSDDPPTPPPHMRPPETSRA